MNSAPLNPNRIEMKTVTNGYAVAVVSDQGINCYVESVVIKPGEGPFPVTLAEAYVNTLVTFHRWIAAYSGTGHYYNLVDRIEIMRVATIEEVEELRNKLYQEERFLHTSPVMSDAGAVMSWDVHALRSNY